MTNRKALARTFQSIVNHVQRGGTLKSQRGTELVDRYNSLRSAMYREDYDGWVAFCATQDAALDHDGYDLFA
jgi:hypothetical protein